MEWFIWSDRRAIFNAIVEVSDADPWGELVIEP